MGAGLRTSMEALPCGDPYISGRLQEAEEIYRARCRSVRKPAARARELVVLGEVLTYQARYAEAKALFDEALRLDESYAGTWQELDEWYLAQDLDPQQALNLIERGISALAGEPSAFRLAAKAWALGRLGRREEACARLDDAFRKAEPEFPPALAELHVAADRTCTAISDPAGARGHFQEAVRLDPRGLYGMIASGFLQS